MKHGVVGMTKTVGLETAGQGITCTRSARHALTPLVEAQIPDQMKVHNMDRDCTVIREVMLMSALTPVCHH